jgi:hypothetical protein
LRILLIKSDGICKQIVVKFDEELLNTVQSQTQINANCIVGEPNWFRCDKKIASQCNNLKNELDFDRFTPTCGCHVGICQHFFENYEITYCNFFEKIKWLKRCAQKHPLWKISLVLLTVYLEKHIRNPEHTYTFTTMFIDFCLRCFEYAQITDDVLSVSPIPILLLAGRCNDISTVHYLGSLLDCQNYRARLLLSQCRLLTTR